MIKEEQYASNINAGTFRTKEEAQAYLAYIRQKYGFDETNSFINGTSVVVTIEKSVTDDSYYYDMVDAIKGEKANRVNQYKMVSESRKNDEGETVPEKCDKCGGKVCVQIHGEPVFVCEKCGKYFGTLPCNLKEEKMKKISINESELRTLVSETISELIYGKKDSYSNVYEELEQMFSGEIDYLYNEGVISYDDEHIKGMANGSIPVDYADLMNATSYDYGNQCSQEALALLKSGQVTDEIKAAADKAIQEYSNYCW